MYHYIPANIYSFQGTNRNTKVEKKDIKTTSLTSL